jgi:hypothetical protein
MSFETGEEIRIKATVVGVHPASGTTRVRLICTGEPEYTVPTAAIEGLGRLEGEFTATDQTIAAVRLGQPTGAEPGPEDASIASE